ncbi:MULTISPECIES: hypothetical protein [unclassified Pseudodesulfovibrio]|nr:MULTISPECIES: hypothetical protein [unclassified Pseudodesulfovibrio]MCJ2166074.1 hypothetical protein [Pseudodesulfovibrio sp. S3-i]
MIKIDTGQQFNAYILKFPAKAEGRVIEEEKDAPEGETLREHPLYGNLA